MRDAEKQVENNSTSAAGVPRDLKAWIASQAQQLQRELEDLRETAEREEKEDTEANAELRRQVEQLEALDGEANFGGVPKAGPTRDRNTIDAARARAALRQVREKAGERRAEWAAERLELRRKLAEVRRSSLSARDATAATARKLGLEEAAWASERASLEAELQVRKNAHIEQLECAGELTLETLFVSLIDYSRLQNRCLKSTMNLWHRCSPKWRHLQRVLNPGHVRKSRFVSTTQPCPTISPAPSFKLL